MSKIKMSSKGSPIWRETEFSYLGHTILVGLEPRCVVLRLKGTRKQFRLPFAQLHLIMCKIEAEANRPQRKRHSVRRNLTAGIS